MDSKCIFVWSLQIKSNHTKFEYFEQIFGNVIGGGGRNIITMNI